MLKYYKSEGGSLVQIERAEPGCWINMVKPNKAEMDEVLESQNVELDFLRAALDPEETSRVEMEDDQVLLIVDIPVIDHDNMAGDIQLYTAIPLGIIVTPETIITVCLEETHVTRDIANGKIRGIHTAMRTRFTFQILLRVAGRFLAHLRRIESSFNQIERRMYEELENDDLLQLLALSKTLVYFSASLKGNEVTMEKMLRGRILKLYDDDRDLLEDALIEIRQAIEMAGIYQSIMSETMETYSSIVSNNMNDIMKALTVITLILTLPNMIFGFYGMNVALPGETILIPIILAVSLCVIAWLYLKKKNLD